MIVLVIACWIILAIATTVIIYTWKISEPIERVFNVVGLMMLLGITISISISINIALQYQGIDKYLNKEITINKIEITYDSQNNPIDTTYYYARNGNKSQSKE